MIYKRIGDLREDKDLKQKDIAEILNITQTAYSKYELGQRNMTPEILIKLSEFYNTSVDFLLGLTDEEKPYKRKNTLH